MQERQSTEYSRSRLEVGGDALKPWTVKSFILRVLAMSAGVTVAVWLTDIRCSGLLPVVAVGTLLAVAQVIVRPALIVTSVLAIRRVPLPMLVLLYLAANVFIFKTIGFIVPGFHVAKYSTALGGSIITGITGFLFHSSLKTKFGVTSARRESDAAVGDESEQASDGMKQAKVREIR